MQIAEYRTIRANDGFPALLVNCVRETDNAMSQPYMIAEYIRANHTLASMEEEVFLLALRNDMTPLGFFTVSHGSMNATMFPVREILQRALLVGATNLIICHNHTTMTEIKPSTDDIAATKRLKTAAELVGLELLDHIIVNDVSFYSFQEQKIVFTKN